MELDEWLEPYRAQWANRLDSLERHLQATAIPVTPTPISPTPKTTPARRTSNMKDSR